MFGLIVQCPLSTKAMWPLARWINKTGPACQCACLHQQLVTFKVDIVPCKVFTLWHGSCPFLLLPCIARIPNDGLLAHAWLESNTPGRILPCAWTSLLCVSSLSSLYRLPERESRASWGDGPAIPSLAAGYLIFLLHLMNQPDPGQ